MPAKAYIAMSENQQGIEKQNLLLMAAGRYTFDGELKPALEILNHMSIKTTTALDQKQILLAKISLLQHNPETAIKLLSVLKQKNTLSIFYQTQYHEILASAYTLTASRVEALNQRMMLDRLLPDESSKMNNRRLLWLSLITMPLSDLNALALEATPHSESQGWLMLALISREDNLSAGKLFEAVKLWQQGFPSHPANSILPTPLDAIKPYLFPKPQKIAVLLPLSGALSGPGNAVKDGINKAREEDNKKQTSIDFYDTSNHNVAGVYEQAIQSGADYVIGPLTKSDVNTIANIPHPIPTLFLNETQTKNTTNAYQFGLSLTSEAKQVAARARKNGRKHALIIAPKGPWGDEIVAAFVNGFEKNGGEILEALRFDDNENMGEPIRQLLHAPSIKQIKAHNSSHIKHRQDADMIFMLAYPSKAREIMPLLRYFYATDIPVFATSTVYSGSPDSMKDRDLDGIIFCDMPWVFNSQMGSRHWPEQLNSYNRLFALGYDSYRLANQLNKLLLFPAMGLNEASGVLYLSQGQTVSRILSWGQFRQGLVQMLGNTD